MTSKLEQLIEHHEGFSDVPYWDKTGQEMWDGLRSEILVAGGPNKDSVKKELGHLTIGFGFNLEAKRSKEFWRYVMRWDIKHATLEAGKYPWFRQLSIANFSPKHLAEYPDEVQSARQAVIISMIYQLGPTGFAGFKRMIAALEEWADSQIEGTADREWSGPFEDAAHEMLDSKWQRKLKDLQEDKTKSTRADELADMMRTGEWPTWLRAEPGEAA